MILITLAVIGVFFLLANIRYWVGDLLAYLERRKVLKIALPVKIDKNVLCKRAHSWIEIQTFSKEDAKSPVCRFCGLIKGTEMMAKPEAIEKIEENNEIVNFEKKLYRDFLNKDDLDIAMFFAEEIKSGLDPQKLIKVYNAGMTFPQRFAMYKVAKMQEVEEKPEKGNA